MKRLRACQWATSLPRDEWPATVKLRSDLWTIRVFWSPYPKLPELAAAGCLYPRRCRWHDRRFGQRAGLE